jgi:hypothetical protein
MAMKSSTVIGGIRHQLHERLHEKKREGNSRQRNASTIQPSKVKGIKEKRLKNNQIS